MKDHSISVDQATDATSIVAKNLDIATVKASKKKIRPLYHLILYSPKQMHLPAMKKLRSLLVKYMYGMTNSDIGAFFDTKVKNRVFVKLDSRYSD